MPNKLKGKLLKLFLIILFLLITAVFILEFAMPHFNFGLPFIYNRRSSSIEIVLTKIQKVS